ncbi:MAG TPA: sodium:proton antiporter [Stackebrandtia sp.]|jgi:CPA1 family monovalent cation:H+ antiporter|uniref:cation:proton antiporter n=1 Tax=Stackebrandtia sp. TaxID=2023065 RepID=UPI002D5AE818|nr:sodium:proton antiporter [Stackebrandtia sp.]HZE40103.1 sodium:proton antiporter [Stackebrandtia sp.]
MSPIAVLFLLVLGGVLLVPVAERLRLPAPILTTGLGLALALIPGVPDVTLSPELILPVVLPPLLYAAARRSSWRQFAANLKPILLLAVVLVFVTTTVVTIVAATIHPALPIGAALVLGAIVSPPDAAAVTTVAGRLGLPRRLVTILEGEGLFNDVVALTLYQVAVAGVVTGSLSPLGSLGSFAYSGIVAVAIGFAVGFVSKVLLDRIADSRLTTALSLLVPYIAYVPADDLHASGVLAVLATAFYLGARSMDPDDIEGRLVRGSFWDVTELMVTAVTFGIIGLELVAVIGDFNGRVTGLALYSGLIAGTVILARAVWMLLAMWVTRWRLSWTGSPIGWRATVVVAWCGMRGVVTTVTALALPFTTRAGDPFPGREQIQLVSMAVVVATLMLQGLSLPWLIGRLGLRADATREAAANRKVVECARQAATRRLEELAGTGRVPTEFVERMHSWYDMVSAAELDPSNIDSDSDAARLLAKRTKIRKLENEMLAAARAALVEARTQPGYDPAAVDSVLQSLDMRSQSLSSAG